MVTLISKKAANWVDRGESALPTMQRILAHFFGRPDDALSDEMHDHALTIEGMVAADSTEIDIAGYLKKEIRLQGRADEPFPCMRVTAIALWHVAKAAQVRDVAERVLQRGVPPNAPTTEPLSQWLAERLLSPDELEEHKRQSSATDDERD